MVSLRLIGSCSLESSSLAHEEHACEGNDGVELGEYGEDQRLAEYVVTLGDAGDTVSTNLTLTDS